MFIYKKESEEAIAAQTSFISNCTSITADILTLPNSPWHINSDPVRYWVSNGQDRLGELQARIIRFLHHNWFSHGKPVFMKARSIAERMSTPKSQIQTAISALVARGILIRVHFMYNSTNRTMILPGTVEFVKFRNKFIEPDPQTQGGYNIFSKLPKSLRESDRLYNILLYFKKKYLNLVVRLQTFLKSISFRNASNLALAGAATPTTKTPLLQKLKKRLQPKPPSAARDDIKQKLLAAEYNLTALSIPDQQLAVSMIDQSLFIDVRRWIRELSLGAKGTVNAAKGLIERACWLFCHDHDLDITFTSKILSAWNTNSPNFPNIQTHKFTKPGSTQFDKYALIMTHAKLRIGEGNILRAIDRLFKDGWNHRNTGFMRGKITIENVFLNPLEKKIWNVMISGSDRDWALFVKNEGYQPKKNRAEIKKAQELMMHFMFKDNKVNGELWTEENMKQFATWFNRLQAGQLVRNNFMAGMDWVQPNGEQPSVMFLFFAWYDLNRPVVNFSIFDLTSLSTWTKFVYHMRLEHHPDFYKRPEQIEKENA